MKTFALYTSSGLGPLFGAECFLRLSRGFVSALFDAFAWVVHEQGGDSSGIIVRHVKHGGAIVCGRSVNCSVRPATESDVRRYETGRGGVGIRRSEAQASAESVPPAGAPQRAPVAEIPSMQLGVCNA